MSLQQLSSSSFHMFIYARSEQRDLVPIYTVTNTQRIRIYPGKLKFVLVQNLIGSRTKETKLYSCFLLLRIYRTPMFTEVQIWRVFRFVQLWVNAFTRWYKRVEAYLGNLIFIQLFCVLFLSEMIPISLLRLNESNFKYGQICTRFCNLSE